MSELIPPELRSAVDECLGDNIDGPVSNTVADAVCAVIESHCERVGWRNDPDGLLWTVLDYAGHNPEPVFRFLSEPRTT